MTQEEIVFAKLTIECRNRATSSISSCFHPNCSEQSINSHILQKNGILSSIAPNNHLWQMEVDNFKESLFVFKRRGLNEIYSFNCFCREHDSNLFAKIETGEIDFNDYESCLLFNLRILYNEMYRKQVNVLHFKLLIEKAPEKYNNPRFIEEIRQQELGIKDLQFTENKIWSDLNNNTQSFVFENRILSKIELCLSSFYDFETTDEGNEYKAMNNGNEMERFSDIFINLFPHKNKSVLLMGYNKLDEKKVKGYFYCFFKENEKRVERRLTNLMLFQCENWVCSENLYGKKIYGNEALFAGATWFSGRNTNERRNFDLNIWDDKFASKLKVWTKANT